MISTETYHSALTISIKAAEDIPQFRFINYVGGICGLGERALGVSSLAATGGSQVTTETLGTMLVESSEAIARGDAISSDANGKAKLADAGEIVNAFALSTCTGAAIIKVRLAI
jgi:hypothetical protein